MCRPGGKAGPALHLIPVPHFPGRFFVENLVTRRSLLFQLVRRDFQQRFVGSAMGWVWGVIHPLVLLASWSFVFSVCLKMPAPEGKSYPLYLFAGMLPWLLFSETVQRSAASLVDHSTLITKSMFPAEIVPVSVFLSSLVSHLMALALAIGAVAVWASGVSLTLVALPLYMLLLGMFAVGIGWIVSSLHVYLRDTAQVMSVLLTFWFWLTPIFISESDVPQRVRFLLDANPLAYVVRAYRATLLDGRWPPGGELAVAALCSAGVFIAGGLFFRHMKRGFADVL